jgi:hypothetical protein
MKKSLLLISVLSALVLAGCGSGSSSSDGKGAQPATSKTVSVIDGYLENVSVYVDRNGDNIPGENELVGVTDANGQVTLQLVDEQYSLIAMVEGGRSNDADRIGEVSRSVTLTAAGGSDVVTPFTTLLSDAMVTLDSLSATLNLPKNVIAGDYVALKSETSKAIIAHTIARTVAGMLSESESTVSASAIITSLAVVIPRLDEYVNQNGIDALNGVTFAVKGEQVSTVINHTDLGSYLNSEERWSFVSLNTFFAQDEGVRKVAFNSVDRTFNLFDQDDILVATEEYLIDGRKLFATGGVSDQFIAITPSIALVKTSEIGDFVVWSKKDIAAPFQAELLAGNEFSGEKWFMLFDDSTTSEPDQKISTFSFAQLDGSPEGAVTITQGDEVIEGSYYVTTEQGQQGVIAPLYINFSATEEPFKLLQLASSESIRVMYEMNRGTYFVFTNDASFAANVIANFN